MFINKKNIYSKVCVYHNIISKPNEYKELLEKSEFEIGGKYHFPEWQDWYGIGTMLNLGMLGKNENLTKKYSDIDHANKQEEFLKEISNCFFEITEDYAKENNIDLSNMERSGLSICRFDPTKNPDYLALSYHTDTHEFDKESPGNKFAITCTMYLNDDYEGGEISFLNEEDTEVVIYKPKAGDIVVFPSGEPYYHGTLPIFNKNRYIIRTWWFFVQPGTEKWFEEQKLHGKEKWTEMEKQRIKKEYESGNYHRHVIYPDSGEPKVSEKSIPFYAKRKRIVG